MGWSLCSRIALHSYTRLAPPEVALRLENFTHMVERCCEQFAPILIDTVWTPRYQLVEPLPDLFGRDDPEPARLGVGLDATLGGGPHWK